MAASSATTMSEIEEFLNGALVSWLESCLSRPEILTGYSSMLDGTIINNVWLQIDPEPQHQVLPIICGNNVEGQLLCIARAKNFESIIRNLKSLYEEELGQTILILPDSYVLGFTPESKNGLEQMKLLLILLLGAAVQCPNKELFIARIKEFNVEIQHAIVDYIKLVTDNHSLVLTQESLEILSASEMYKHIMRLTKERDSIQNKWIGFLTMASESEGSSTNSTQSNQSTPLSSSSGIASSNSTSSESNHLAVELADSKSKLRKLRQELEEKSESYLELKEEMEHKNQQYDKLRTESQDWYSEAKRASAYRDEVDVLRERAERADYLEVEVQKFREKLSDSEFYKTRVEELREDNKTLLETKDMLEDQLSNSRKRSEQVMQLESEIIKYKQKLNDMALERDLDRSKLQDLLEENTQLQLVAKNLNSTIEFDKSLSDEEECNSGDNSLSEQLTNNAQTRALKLELENRRLLAALDQMKESTFHESMNKILELEKEKKKLALKNEQLQENCSRMSQQNKELEDVFKNALEENKKLQDTMDLRQKAHERQSQEREGDRTKIMHLEQTIETIGKEKQRVQTLNESIQRRADDLDRQVESKLKEIDSLSLKLTDFDEAKHKLYEMENKVAASERETTSLLKEVAKLKECLEEKSVILDEQVTKNESQLNEITTLSKDLVCFVETQSRVAELEKQNQELLSQRDIDAETIATLQKDLVSGTLATNKVKHNLEKLGIDNQEIENSDLNVEIVVEKLVKNPETFKTVREIMLSCSREQRQNNKSDMCVLCHRKEIYTVEKNIELSGDEDYNMPSKSKDTINQLTLTNQALEQENKQLETENARLNVDVATLGSQVTSLNAQHTALQVANTTISAEKDILLKQIEIIKQEHKTLTHDQITLQCLHDQLSAEYDSLNKDKESLKSLVRDLRGENRELRERASALEKELESLRSEIRSLKQSQEEHMNLKGEHSKLTEDFRNLFSTSDRFKTEYKNLQEQYKLIRTENARLKLQNTEISGDINTKDDHIKSLEIENSKLSQSNDMLRQMNANLDTDRKTLMDNVSQMLTQYHELLTHSLEDKQHWHEEEKNFTDKVNNLNRQKEKLEEKIMEHYRRADNCAPKKKAFASNLVRRVKKASSELINKVPTSKVRVFFI
ncbi:CCDC88A family protein [Megaselia abdita]